jgi:hypothetical protein
MKLETQQLTKEQAIAFADSEIWKSWTAEQIVRMQLFQRRLCVPFNVFHESVGEVFGRDVYTHEFANSEALMLEYLGFRPAPTLDEIIEMIPEDKRRIIGF